MKPRVSMALSAEHYRRLGAVAGALNLNKQQTVEFLIEAAGRQIFGDLNPTARADRLCSKGTLMANLPQQQPQEPPP